MVGPGRHKDTRALLLLFGIALIAAACAPTRPSLPPPAGTPAAPAAGAPAAAVLSPVELATEMARLRAALVQEVPQAIIPAPERQRDHIARTQGAVTTAGLALDHPQLLVVVDRNPDRQELSIILARPDGQWEVISGSRVSTGQPDRRGYYITPTGVFLHTDAILDWRAEGTFNANHIRGLGLKGMRVWDFGWVPARKGWRADGETGEIRLLLHATDPDALEQRLGRPASQGCVRIPAAMNRFLDRHGVLDSDHERAAAAGDERFGALLLPDREPTPLAGRALVVIDSSEPP